MLELIGEYRCNLADCDTCRLFDLPSDEPAFDAWVHRIQNDIRNDPYVISQRFEERGIITFKERTR